MPSYPLILDTAPLQPGWLIEWDNAHLKVLTPDGHVCIELPLNRLHEAIDLRTLDIESRIVFTEPIFAVGFKQAERAAIELRKIVLESMRSDPTFLQQHIRYARLQIIGGVVMFIICGGAFGLYCWWASVAPEPVPNWVRSTGGLIHAVLLICLAGAIAGPMKVFFYLRRLAHLRDPRKN
jgi:hypothetical protein